MNKFYLNDFKDKMEASLRNRLIQVQKDTQKLPDFLHEIVVMQFATSFLKSYKEAYPEWKKSFANLNEDFLEESEFNSIVGETLAKVLREYNQQPFSSSVGLDLESVPEKRALSWIGNKYNCAESEAKDYFLKELRIKRYGVKDIREVISNMLEKLPDQANELNLADKETPFFLLATWAQEYIDSGAYKDRIRTKGDVFDDFFETNPEINEKFNICRDWVELVNSGQVSEEQRISLLEESDNADNPGGNYYNIALVKVYKEKDYSEALRLLNKGLSLEPIGIENYYMIRAVCYENLQLLKEAIEDLERAKEIISKTFELNDPADDYYVNKINAIDEDIKSLKDNGYMKSTRHFK